LNHPINGQTIVKRLASKFKKEEMGTVLEQKCLQPEP